LDGKVELVGSVVLDGKVVLEGKVVLVGSVTLVEDMFKGTHSYYKQEASQKVMLEVTLALIEELVTLFIKHLEP